MHKETRQVPPCTVPRCPECFCFIASDSVRCSACGSALVAGTRRAETQIALSSEVQVVDFQNGPKGNAQTFEFQPIDFLKPNGQKKKIKHVEDNNLSFDFERGL